MTYVKKQNRPVLVAASVAVTVMAIVIVTESISVTAEQSSTIEERQKAEMNHPGHSDKAFSWDPLNKPRVGEPHLKAYKLEKEPEEYTIYVSQIPWFEDVINNPKKEVPITNPQLQAFYHATENGVLDVKVVSSEGTVNYYDIDYMEIP